MNYMNLYYSIYYKCKLFEKNLKYLDLIQFYCYEKYFLIIFYLKKLILLIMMNFFKNFLLV